MFNHERINQPPQSQKTLKKKLVDFVSKGFATNTLSQEEILRMGKEKLMKEAYESFQRQIIEELPQQTQHALETAADANKRLGLSDDIMQSPEIQEVAKKILINILRYDHNINLALEKKEELRLPNNIFQSPEVQEAIKQSFNGIGAERAIKLAVEIKEKIGLSDTLKQSPDLQKYISETLHEFVSQARINAALEVQKELAVSEYVLQEIVKRVLLVELSKPGRNELLLKILLEIKEKLGFANEILQSPDVQKAAKEKFVLELSSEDISTALEITKIFNIPERITQEVVKEELIKGLSGGQIDYVLRMKEKFNLSDKVIQFYEVQKAAAQRLIHELPSRDGGDAFKIKEGFNLSDKVIQSFEIQEAVKQGFINLLLRGRVSAAVEIKEKFNLSDKIAREAAMQSLIDQLSRGYVGNVALKIKEKFNLSDKIIQSFEVQEAAKQGLMHLLSSDEVIRAVEIKEGFNLSDKVIQSFEIQEAARDSLIKYLRRGRAGAAVKTKEGFNLSDKVIQSFEIQEAVKQGLIACLRRNDTRDAVEIKEKFNLSDGVIQSFEIQEAARKTLMESLLKGWENNALEIKEKFNVSSETIYESLPGDKKEILNRLTSIFPGLKEKMLNSFELLARLTFINETGIQTIEAHPFLLQAFEANPPMAVKLLKQFVIFDKTSVENIVTAYSFKSEILKENPDVDPNSHEFRIHMQERLRGYKHNNEIVATLTARGVQVERWLSYDKEKTIELGGAEQSVAEMIRVPIDRMGESFNEVFRTIEDILSEYKAELIEGKIPVRNLQELKDKIEQMKSLREEALEHQDLRKAAGVEKGIASLEKQLSTIKMIPAWDKITSLFDTVRQAFNKLLEDNNEIVTLTESLKDENKTKKEKLETKRQIEIKTGEIRQSLGSLETRFVPLFDSTQEVLSLILGKDRAVSLRQEVHAHISETLDHLSSDINSLKTALEENGTEKSGSVTIKIWDRNPDIDLYMGNYTDCCVRIDSDYHEAECVISDYLTDLGIQIVAVYDNKTDKPFAAAWCWVGEDGKQTAFVVDNIEADGPNMKYKERIEDELKQYIEEFSEAVGISKNYITQGPNNNDMIITKALEERYVKVGGYNRADGYYLEAEPDEEDADDEFEDDDEWDNGEFENVGF